MFETVSRSSRLEWSHQTGLNSSKEGGGVLKKALWGVYVTSNNETEMVCVCVCEIVIFEKSTITSIIQLFNLYIIEYYAKPTKSANIILFGHFMKFELEYDTIPSSSHVVLNCEIKIQGSLPILSPNR